MMAHALHTFEGGHCTRCGMPFSPERAGLPCPAASPQQPNESRALAHDDPPVIVRDDDGEP